MWSKAREIAAGDLVIIWLTRESLQPLVITPGKEFNGKFGVYSHSDLIGVPYGSKIGSRNGKGFIHVLRPTPELWTTALPHRTQILYLADIAFIVSYLNIKHGSTIIEAGTGSGSFSHSVARTIGPSGRLYTYEFHEARANKAREEFRRHNLSDIITLTHRNVCKDGFTIVDEADSVFLDLPAPWDAVEHAKRALRKDRITRICCFSPCMEQVLRTVSALNDAGFTEVTMYETLLRPHEVHTVPSLRPIQEVSDKLKKSEKRREEKRLAQVAASLSRKEHGGKKRKRDVQGTEGTPGDTERLEETGFTSSDALDPPGIKEARSDAKKPRTEGAIQDHRNTPSGTGDANAPIIGSDAPFLECIAREADNQVGSPEEQNTNLHYEREELVVIPEPPPSIAASTEPETMVVSKVVQEVRGHTSYLTFAVLLPKVVSFDNQNVVIDAGSAKKISLNQEEVGHGADAINADSLPTDLTHKADTQDILVDQ